MDIFSLDCNNKSNAGTRNRGLWNNLCYGLMCLVACRKFLKANIGKCFHYWKGLAYHEGHTVRLYVSVELKWIEAQLTFESLSLVWSSSISSLKAVCSSSLRSEQLLLGSLDVSSPPDKDPESWLTIFVRQRTTPAAANPGIEHFFLTTYFPNGALNSVCNRLW